MSITPSTKIKIGLPVIEIKYLAKQNELTYEEVLFTINEMLLYVLEELLLELENWINKFVPKATGQLRDSLIANLYSSSVKKGLMRVILGTHLDYAEDVAAMSTMKVRHFGEKRYAYYYSASGPIILDDPQAIGNFWEELIKYAQERCMNILQRAIDEYFVGTGKLMRMVRSRV